jgi:hypothetical protein
MYTKTPPYVDQGLDFLTVYFHIVGLHNWLYWRHYAMRDANILALLRSFNLEGEEDPLLMNVRRHIVLGAKMLMVLQVIGIGLGFAVFAQPALEHWKLGHGAPEEDRRFALVHGVLMYIAIPAHVPTLIAAYGLFFFVSRLHALDATRVVNLLKDTSQPIMDPGDHASKAPPGSLPVEGCVTNSTSGHGKEYYDSCAAVCCYMVESVQSRLWCTCSTLQWLWIHQLLYTFAQLLVVTIRGRAYWMGTFKDDRASFNEMLYVAWHAYIGFVGLLALVVTPAAVTHVFEHIPHSVEKGLRAREAPVRSAINGAKDVAFHVVGFSIFGNKVSPNTVVIMASLIMTAFTLHMDLSAAT